MRLQSSRACLLCGQCVKVCRPANMSLFLRFPFASSDARESQASWPVTLFVMLVSGFVTWELLAEWPRGEEVFLWLPQALARLLDLPRLAGLLDGIWALVGVPLLLWSSMAGLHRVTGGRLPASALWRMLALPIAVIVSAGHMTKALAKLGSWAPFLPHALSHPDGLETARTLSANPAAAPGAWIGLPSAALVGAVLVLGALVLALREARLAAPPETQTAADSIPKLALATAFLAVLAGWRLF